MDVDTSPPRRSGESQIQNPTGSGSEPWWARSDLAYEDGRLLLAGRDLERLARDARGPLFAYSAPRITQKLGALRSALRHLPQPSKVFYAMKANRFLPVLKLLKDSGVDGIDACSPNEVRLALEAGFPEDQISFTGCSVSNSDLDFLAAHPGVWVNCDSLSMVRRLGERSPGRKVGLRINPQIGIGYRQNKQLRYSGDSATKFGIYFDRFEEALELADRSGLDVTGIHFHVGCGFLDDQIPSYHRLLRKALRFLKKIPHLTHVNLGGGLGVPLVEGDAPLDLAAWTGVIGDVLGGLDATIWIEPGDYLVKDAGVMVLEINTIEEKGGRRFVGVNGGFNLHIEPAFYELPLEIAPCSLAPAPGRECQRDAAVVGNINEALDVFARRIDLPPVREGDFLAFLNAGGYGSSMGSNHCMRGTFAEVFLG